MSFKKNIRSSEIHLSFLKLPLDKCPYKMYHDKCTDKKKEVI
nr:MAG TPA: hypothetical protein [Caudoviricetes sp.]